MVIALTKTYYLQSVMVVLLIKEFSHYKMVSLIASIQVAFMDNFITNSLEEDSYSKDFHYYIMEVLH